MIKPLFDLLKGALLCAVLVPACGLADTRPPERLQLLARTGEQGPSATAVDLSPQDLRWLWERRVVRLGVSQPDYPPFDMTVSGRDYEGITADYLGQIARLLKLEVQVLRYPTRARALQALQDGEIDLLGTSNTFEVANANLLFSQAYGVDQTVLARRVDSPDAQLKSRRTLRLAVVQHYLPDDVVQLLYPDAQVQVYDSPLGALGAVAFGQADLYLGNALGAHYELSRSQLGNLQLNQVPELREHHFGFALAPGNERLLGLIDAALQVVDASERQLILRRWSVEGVVIPTRVSVPLTLAEQRWMRRNPKVKVLIDERLMPISYRDEQGQFRGISAQVLDAISQRTGLVFDVRSSTSVVDMADQVSRGDVQLVAALAASPARAERLAFSRPYLNSSMVLVTRDDSRAASSLEQLNGRNVAVVEGSFLYEDLQERYPDVSLLAAQSPADALVLVAQGKADGALLSLLSARYLLAARYRGELRISAALALGSANFAFATARGQTELLSIIDKALLSIEPQELDALTRRNRPHVIVADGYWHRHRETVIKVLFGGATLLFLAALWISWLRRQIRRRERAEYALLDQLEFMRVMINGTPHPIYVRDREGLLLNCNASYLEALGQTRDEAIGKPITMTAAVAPEQAQFYQESYLRVMALGQPIVEDRSLTLASGKELTIYHWILPYQGSGGRTVGLIAGWIDVTDRERLCAARQQATEEAEAANVAKTQFLATMSHEIRTPMNAVLGMLELALKKADEGVLDRLAIEVASEAAQGLLDLIGDILDITRIESGHLQLAPQPVELQAWSESVVRLYDAQARHKGLVLRLKLSGDTGQRVMLDPLRLRQVVANLLGNAIKFTETGHVQLSLQVQPAGDQVRLVLCVEDTGVGIAAAELQQLGEPFTQASNQAANGRIGAGLGLSISRSLCELMGGNLQLHSRLGEGTQVWVTLQVPRVQTQPSLEPGAQYPQVCPPQAAGAQAQPTPPPATGDASLTILVVDDYPANCLLLSQQLNYLGHQVVVATEGVSGFERWRTGHFDAVITDCNMPGGDGYRLARQIRASERERGSARCLILGCTANAQPQERLRCIEAGMDDCLFKPLGLTQVAERLSQMAGTAPACLPASVVDLSELRRLTGECTESFRLLLRTLLECHRKDLQDLDELTATGDLHQAEDLIHRVKGSARMIRAEAVLQACAFCEAVSEDSAEALDNALVILREAMGEVSQALEHSTGDDEAA